MKKRITFFFPLTIVLISIVAFFPTFFNDFQKGWDDTWQLLENPFVLNSSWVNIVYHFLNFWEGQYSPVNTVVYITIHKLFGFNPIAFHAVCLGIHIVNALLIFYIIKDIIRNVKPGIKADIVKLYALFVSLIFVLHPLQVESVAWISASKIILYAFFTLIALWCYIKYIHTSKWIWFVWVVMAYALSFGSKEQAIILPLNLLILDYVYGRLKGTELKISVFYKKVVLEKIPFFSLAFLFWYFSHINNLGNINAPNTYPLYQRLLMGMHSLIEYIFRTIAPVKLYYFYFFPIRVGEKLPLFFWGYLVLTTIMGAFIWNNYKKRNQIVIFGFLFFFVNILLVLHIIPMPRDMITADRYMYLSIVGLALIAVWLVHYVMIRFNKYIIIIKCLILMYIMFLGVQTFIRTQDWKNSEIMKSNVNKLIEKRKVLNQRVIDYPLIPNQNE